MERVQLRLPLLPDLRTLSLHKDEDMELKEPLLKVAMDSVSSSSSVSKAMVELLSLI